MSPDQRARWVLRVGDCLSMNTLTRLDERFHRDTYTENMPAKVGRFKHPWCVVEATERAYLMQAVLRPYAFEVLTRAWRETLGEPGDWLAVTVDRIGVHMPELERLPSGDCPAANSFLHHDGSGWVSKYVCCRQTGHTGRHLARGARGYAIAAWSDPSVQRKAAL